MFLCTHMGVEWTEVDRKAIATLPTMGALCAPRTRGAGVGGGAKGT